MARAFDTNTRRLKGEPLVVAKTAPVNPPFQSGLFSLSVTNVLAYSRTAESKTDLMWIDRGGKPIERAAEPGTYINFDLNGDDSQVAVSQDTPRLRSQTSVDIWVLDLARAGAGRQVTFDLGRTFNPAWARNSPAIAFGSGEKQDLYVLRLDGHSQPELVRKSETVIENPDWSPDGNLLLYSERAPGSTQRDVWMIPLSGSRSPSAVLHTPADESAAVFSPDGHWIAYRSNREVYVKPFPEGPEHLVSSHGGRVPLWRRSDGRELYFLAPNGTLMMSRIELQPKFSASPPVPLFETGLTSDNTHRAYAVARDGKRFLIPTPSDAPSVSPITVVLNWPATLAK
jgi:Tol biopolymer transport system component